MKTSSIASALLASIIVSAHAQNAGGSVGADQNDVPAATAYQEIERGANHRVWQRETYERSPSGEVIPHIHKYTELSAGLNYKDSNGQWQESKEEIESYPGEAIARHGQYQVIFANNLNSYGAIDMNANGQRLRSNILGLMYHDTATDEAVLIASLQDSKGELISSNQVLYPNAFEGLKADVRYTYRKGGFEQDVVLREQPPTPESFGLNPDTTEIEVMTEFINPPQASVRDKKTSGQGSDADQEISWGEVKLGHGKAFQLGERTSKVPVSKRYTTVQGRYFLLEKVPVKEIEAEVAKLPEQAAIGTKLPVLALKDMTWPKTPSGRAGASPMRMAAITPPDNGYVLDYTTISSSLTNYTFKGDTTYYISGNLNLSGTTTIEGGTVVKYLSPNGPAVTVYDSFNCKTAPYRPAVFTSKNDNSVGETISGSTGSPQIDHGYNCYYLVFDSINPVELHDIRMSYCYCGVTSENGDINLSDAQFIHADYPVYLFYANCKARNILMSDIQVVAFEQCVSTNQVSHMTLDQCVSLGMNDWQPAISLTNCLLTGVASMGDIPYVTNHVITLSTNSNVFQKVGGGSYYLATNSPYRNVGTTNIDSTLLTDLAAKTTYPPIVYSNTAISVATILSPQAQRDSDTPDLGYHYDPLDYAFGSVNLYSNLTFTAGTGVGFFVMSSGAGYGIKVYNGSTVAFNGNVMSPCHFARYNNVQEGGNGNWTLHGWLAGIAGAGSGSTYPKVAAQFTIFSSTAGSENYVRDYYCQTTVEANSCEFYSGILTGYGMSLNLTNDLFDPITWLGNGTDGSCSLALRNCTLHGGGLYIQHWSSSTWPVWIENCAFDGTDLTTYMTEYSGGNTNITYCNYNAFLQGATQLPHERANTVTVTNYNWQTSWLGDFYLPSDSPLIDHGSATADRVGLYHFTTQTNQTPEFGSQVDIGYHYVSAAPAGLVAGLVAYYPLNEGTGTVSADGSGNGYNGTLVNSPTWISGVINGALTTDTGNAGSEVTVPSVPLGSCWTAAWWSYFPLATFNGSWRTMFRSFSGGGNDHQVIVNSSGYLGMYDNDFGSGFNSSGYNVNSLSGWHHLAAAYSGGVTTFYVDAVAVGSVAKQNTDNIDVIGNFQGGHQNWGGFDDLRIYNHALSARELADLVNKTFTPISTDLDGDGIPDYLEDTNGNGVFDAGDLSNWLISSFNGLSSANGLSVFTPLK